MGDKASPQSSADPVSQPLGPVPEVWEGFSLWEPGPLCAHFGDPRTCFWEARGSSFAVPLLKLRLTCMSSFSPLSHECSINSCRASLQPPPASAARSLRILARMFSSMRAWMRSRAFRPWAQRAHRGEQKSGSRDPGALAPNPTRRPYPVQSAEGHVYGQREEIAGHFLEGLYQLLLVFPAARHSGLAAQQDAHGDAEHKALHLGIDQEAALAAAQPLLQVVAHFLGDHWHVALKRLAAEGLHNHLNSEEGRVLKPGSTRPSCLPGSPSRHPQPHQTQSTSWLGKLHWVWEGPSRCLKQLAPTQHLSARIPHSNRVPLPVQAPPPLPHLLALLVRGVVQVREAPGTQDGAHGRGPVDRHQPVLSEQNAPHVVRSHHPHRGPPE